jgi:hypothetical protein
LTPPARDTLDLGALGPLWRDRVLALLGNLAGGERWLVEIRNAAAHIEADYHGRFLVELIQNAADQAGEGSTIVLARTEDAVAVFNDGRPFDMAGVKGVTSLGLSEKDPAHAIGNKGIGFKAVFEVSDAPVVISTGEAFGSLRAGTSYRFRLDRAPLAVAGAEATLLALAGQIFDDLPGLMTRLKSPWQEAFLQAVREGASFKFPVPLAPGAAADLFTRMDLPHGVLEHARTAVILPLRRGADGGIPDKIRVAVDKAFGELRGRAGATILFLPQVAHLRLLDRGQDTAVTRSVLANRDGLVQLESSVGPWDKPPTSARRWWTLARTLGEGPEGAEERAAIRASVADLPGKGWNEVQTATVQVALPIPDGAEGAPLGADGLLYIGLPTHDATGTPFSLEARFHGTISRTNIDLETLPYNALLFATGATLVGQLVRTLQTSPDRTARLAATLALERTPERPATGNTPATSDPLAGALYEPEGLAHQAVILERAGTRYLCADALDLPMEEDLDVFAALAAELADPKTFGFVLPDPVLLDRSRVLLYQLARARRRGQDPRYLARPDGTPSVLERRAARIRGAGETAWAPFLTWVLERFKTEDLRDQQILPVGEAELVASDARVFIAPTSTVPAAEDPLPDPTDPTHEEEDIAFDTLPPDTRTALRFFDATALAVRTPGSRVYTPLAGRLAPLRGAGLVRRPRLAELVNDAIAPSLERAVAAGDTTMAVALLRVALDWIDRMRPATREEVRVRALLVPTLGGGWRAPDSVYFGRGWLEDTQEDDLLAEAYGAATDRQLPAWPAFAELFGMASTERAEVRARLGGLGVAAYPRILRASPKLLPPLLGRHHHLESANRPAPFPGADKEWAAYLASFGAMTISAQKTQPYDFANCTWIDGLELDDARAAVVELMLRHPEPYEATLTTVLKQANTSADWQEVPSLWVWAVRTRGWLVIPVDGDPDRVHPGAAWWLGTDRRSAAGLLRRVQPRFASAVKLLRAIGVYPIQVAPAARLVDALHTLAERGDDALLEADRAALTLARELFLELQHRAAAGTINLTGIGARPLPLQRGRHLRAVRLAPDEAVYVEDDPVRAAFIPAYDQVPRLPVPSRESVTALVTALRAAFGDARVQLTSTCPVSTGFTAAPDATALPFFDLVDTLLPGRGVAQDLAVLVAYGGKVPSIPGKRDFDEAWSRFNRLHVLNGRFTGVPHRSFYDADLLLVSEDLGPHEVVEATWALLGVASRDLWSAYARALAEGSAPRFFAERHLTDTERGEVEAYLGVGVEARCQHLLAALFAIRTHSGHLDADEFRRDLAEHGKTTASLATWLGSAALAAPLGAALAATEEVGSLGLLEAAKLGPGDWQEARRRLGQGSWSFEAPRASFVKARDQLVAALASACVHTASANLAAAHVGLDALRRVTVAPNLLLDPHSLVLPSLLAEANQRFDTIPDDRTRQQLVKWLPAADAWTRDWRPRAATDREARCYRDDAAADRSRSAGEVARDVLRVAVALAPLLGEAVDEQLILANARVGALCEGWWANRFGVLHALQEVLEPAGPQTTGQLSAVGAFTHPHGWQELWSKLPELGKLPSSSAPPAPPVNALGTSWSRDALAEDLKNGVAGAAGALLHSCVTPGLDFGQWLNATRKPLAPRNPNGPPKPPDPDAPTPPDPTNAPPDAGPGTRPPDPPPPPSPRETQRERDLNGLLGEAFAYLQLARSLPDFDSSCWVSSNRGEFGFEPVPDKHGCDFLYVDGSGTLSGRPDTRCYIEVKSTSGTGRDPFPITETEWGRARVCSEGDGREVYFILRVANVRNHPRIADLLVDPYRMEREGRLRVEARDRQVYAGAVVPTATVGMPAATQL